jgi:hypothetical protein
MDNADPISLMQQASTLSANPLAGMAAATRLVETAASSAALNALDQAIAAAHAGDNLAAVAAEMKKRANEAANAATRMEGQAAASATFARVEELIATLSGQARGV